MQARSESTTKIKHSTRAIMLSIVILCMYFFYMRSLQSLTILTREDLSLLMKSIGIHKNITASHFEYILITSAQMIVTIFMYLCINIANIVRSKEQDDKLMRPTMHVAIISMSVVGLYMNATTIIGYSSEGTRLILPSSEADFDIKSAIGGILGFACLFLTTPYVIDRPFARKLEDMALDGRAR